MEAVELGEHGVPIAEALDLHQQRVYLLLVQRAETVQRVQLLVVTLSSRWLSSKNIKFSFYLGSLINQFEEVTLWITIQCASGSVALFINTSELFLDTKDDFVVILTATMMLHHSFVLDTDWISNLNHIILKYSLIWEVPSNLFDREIG